jgi:hypothetical protein
MKPDKNNERTWYRIIGTLCTYRKLATSHQMFVEIHLHETGKKNLVVRIHNFQKGTQA